MFCKNFLIFDIDFSSSKSLKVFFPCKINDGNEEIWDARGSPVVWLARKGWTRDSIKVGDKVTMHGFAGRDDRRMLSIITITLKDGTILVDKVPE